MERKEPFSERASDRPFDARPVRGAALSDIDRLRFEEEYLPAAISPEVLHANERTNEQRLAAAKMINAVDEPTPTVVGVLVLGVTTTDFLPYRSLMALAQEARKPMFMLRTADGAIGAQASAVRSCYKDFEQLARRIAERCDVDLP